MSLKEKKVADIYILKSEFNKNLVEELYESALTELQADRELNVKSLWVAGAGEIPQAVQWILQHNSEKLSKEKSIAGILALGVIIRGKTPHFDFLRDFLQTALWDLQKSFSIPIVFSVLMLENREQFKDRVIRANEAMKALLKMIDLKDQISKGV